MPRFNVLCTLAKRHAINVCRRLESLVFGDLHLASIKDWRDSVQCPFRCKLYELVFGDLHLASIKDWRGSVQCPLRYSAP